MVKKLKHTEAGMMMGRSGSIVVDSLESAPFSTMLYLIDTLPRFFIFNCASEISS